MKLFMWFKSILVANIYLLFASALVYAGEPVSTGYLSNIAIGGKDTTAYHQLQPHDSALEGQKTYTVEWKGAQWRFISKEDAERFSANPERYAPAYNGHCANALSLGEGLIRTDGSHWLILDNQLYLFFAERGSKRWLSGDYKAFKAEADKAWQQLSR